MTTPDKLKELVQLFCICLTLAGFEIKNMTFCPHKVQVKNAFKKIEHQNTFILYIKAESSTQGWGELIPMDRQSKSSENRVYLGNSKLTVPNPE